MAIVISIGKWGNVYFYHGFGWRLCLGWIAITVLSVDGDVILDWAASHIAKRSNTASPDTATHDANGDQE
jgi:hypothetical protein